jgi:DNA polymerase-3 subunit epsilon
VIALVLDTETSGLDPSIDKIVEIAWATYWVEKKVVLNSASFLVRWKGYELKTEAITGISAEMTQCQPQHFKSDGIQSLFHAWEASDVVLAHNAEFDRSFLMPFFMAELATEPRPKRWVCSLRELPWPCPPGKLGHMAYDLGIVPGCAHRAAGDVATLCGLLGRIDRLDELLAPNAPRWVVVAQLPYDRRDEAKAAGFTWEPGPKRWSKVVYLTPPTAADFSFRVIIQEL